MVLQGLRTCLVNRSSTHSYSITILHYSVYMYNNTLHYSVYMYNNTLHYSVCMYNNTIHYNVYMYSNTTLLYSVHIYYTRTC